MFRIEFEAAKSITQVLVILKGKKKMKTKLIQNKKSGSDKPFQLYCISGKVTQSVDVSNS